jgi:hypothetical protein
MHRNPTHTIRLGGREIRRSRAALAGAAVAAIVLAAVITPLALRTGRTPPPSRPAAGTGSMALPTLAMTSFAGYPGQTAGAPRLAVNAIATGDGQRLAVGGTDGHPAVWRQDASGAWTLVTSLSGLPARPGNAALMSVVRGPAGWLAVGTPWPVSLTSGDGVTWRPGGPDSDDLAGVLSIAAAGGPHGYVVLGKALAASGRGCVADVWWSKDLRTWKRAHDVNGTNGSSQTLAVAAKTDGFVSAGSHNGRPAIWVTTNGTAWRTIDLPAPANAQFNQIAVNGNDVVATGGWDTQHAVTPAFAEFSADGGLHWQMSQLALPSKDTVITALTATPKGFVAAGSYGGPGQHQVAVWTSTTGASWTPAHVRGLTDTTANRTRGITALVASKDATTGIGPADPPASRQAVIFTLPAH